MIRAGISCSKAWTGSSKSSDKVVRDNTYCYKSSVWMLSRLGNVISAIVGLGGIAQYMSLSFFKHLYPAGNLLHELFKINSLGS